MDAGAARTPNAPLVQGKAALLRVFVTPTAAWTKRAVVGKLKVGSQSQEVTWTPNGASTNSKLSSSLNFNVPGSWLTLGAKFSVQLVEATSGAYSGTTADSRYPSSGTAALGVKSPGGAFRVKLVPIKINGRLPLLNQARQDAYRDYFLAQYPTATLNLSVRAAWTYNSSVAADGTGWPALLSALQQLRQNDNAGPKTYYYGLLAPAGSSSAYCGGACIAGLSNVVGPNDENYRAAIGLGVFADGSDVGWLETSAHELGHAQGRLHAPCGTTVSVDAAFPFAGGKIGRWGYDKRSKTLLNPSQVLDVMGYCDPRWISDYTYKALFNRMAAVNAQAALVLPPGSLRGPGAFIAYQLTPDGRLELLGRVQQRSNALGEARRVYPVDRSGSLLAPIDGYYTPYGEEELGGSLLVPLGALPASSERLVSDSWLAQP